MNFLSHLPRRPLLRVAFLQIYRRPLPALVPARFYAAECNAPTEVTTASIEALLRENLRVKNVLVTDVSELGNGSFFQVAVQSPDFKGLTMLKQHQKVNTILKGALQSVHGIQIKTFAVDEE